jgi:hypothetical protein
MSNTAKIRLLPIDWKDNNGVLEGRIGTFVVGKIISQDNAHNVSVWNEGVQITSCQIEYSTKTKDSSLQQAKDYVSTKITDRIVSDYNTVSNFIEK